MIKQLIQWFKQAMGRQRATPQAAPVLDAPSWSFAHAWNQSLVVRPERPVVARDYVWASEIGGAMIDRYLRMTGTPPSNAPNMRSLRKFQAGNIFEWICELVLRRAGILIDSQTKLSHQYPGLLRVSGKLDFLAGGQPNWNKARKELDFLGMPEMLHNASVAIIDRLEKTYGDRPLKTIILEIKSASSFMFDVYERTNKPNANHRAQIFHYLKSMDLPEGHVVYVCKDDCRLLEFEVMNPSSIEGEYIADLTEITHYITTNTKPELEREILFDGIRFQKNWKIEYSNYLTLLYGYKLPMDYREAVDKPIASFNRTFKRCVVKAKMTDLNLATIKQAMVNFPNWWELVVNAQEAAKNNPELLEPDETIAA